MTEPADPFARMTLAGFSERLASAAAVPGGGSAAAVAAALAASLLAMVARLSQDREKYSTYSSTHQRALEVAEASRARFLEMSDRDADAFAAFAEAARLPRDGQEQADERQAAMRASARTAAEVPLLALRECHRLVREIEAMAGRSNLNASSDLEVAALLAQAAARGSAANVLTNLRSVGDERFAGVTTAEVGAHLHEIEASVSRVNEQVLSGNLRSREAE